MPNNVKPSEKYWPSTVILRGTPAIRSFIDHALRYSDLVWEMFIQDDQMHVKLPEFMHESAFKEFEVAYLAANPLFPRRPQLTDLPD